jgi:hypothetical protein
MRLAEFQGPDCLSVSEVHILLQQQRDSGQREKSDNPYVLALTAQVWPIYAPERVFRKTEEYVSQFARFSDGEQALAVRQ